MKNEHYNVYFRYYDTVIGRFYTKEQKGRLLRLFLSVANVKNGSKEHKNIVDTINVIDEQNILDYTESKNYKMLCTIFGKEGELCTAASALADVFYEHNRSNTKGEYNDFLNWIIAIRTGYPRSKDIRFELVYFEYSNGDIPSAIAALKELVNEGDISAIEYLACIYEEQGEFEDAYYYFSLLNNVYKQELKIATPQVISERISLLQSHISPLAIQSISKNIASLASVLLSEKNREIPMGFTNSEHRRLTYEH